MNLIRVAGTPEWSEFSNGLRIYNPHTNKLFVRGEGWNRFVATADYDNHFLALNPKFLEMIGSNFAYCSCGSFAIVVGYNAYRDNASPSSGGDGMVAGELLCCYSHITYGKHEDGST